MIFMAGMTVGAMLAVAAWAVEREGQRRTERVRTERAHFFDEAPPSRGA
jgi:hypothetical protein